MKKIKTLIAIGLLTCFAATFAPPARAQDGIAVTPGFANTVFGQVTTFLTSPEASTNRQWIMVGYGSYAEGLKNDRGQNAEWGGGFALLYPLNATFSTGLRMQYFADNWYTPSVTVQANRTWTFGNFETKLFGWTGAGIPVGGSTDNGEASLLYGIGASAKYRFSDKIAFGLGYGIEWSPGLKSVKNFQHFGPVLDIRF